MSTENSNNNNNNNNSNSNNNESIVKEGLPKSEETVPVKTETKSQTEIIKETLIDYFDMVSSARSERAKYLAKKNVYKIYNSEKDEIVEYQRFPLNSKQMREVQTLRMAAINFDSEPSKKKVIGGTIYEDSTTMYFDAFRLMAKYGLHITDDNEYDSLNYEDDEELEKKDVWGLRAVLEGCLLRGTHGNAYFQDPSKSA